MDDAHARPSDPFLANEIGFLAVKAGAKVSKIARSRLRPLGLHVRTYSVLALSGTGDGRTQREIAEYLDLDPSQVVSLVDELEKSGLVTRGVVPGDRRAKLISATPEGMTLLQDASQATSDGENEALARLTPDERRTLLLLLRKAALPDAASP